jgi:hypothetical protein
MKNWIFQEASGMGDLNGEAIRSTLLNQGLTHSEILAREAIQNSCDAPINPSDNEKIKVVFRLVTLKGKEKQDFLANRFFYSDIKKRRNSLGLQPNNAIDNFEELEKPLHLLYIEDFGTHGIYGNPHSQESHFHKLLLSHGNRSKARENSGSGGSYGFGKAAYAGNSNIYTIFAYSEFDPERIDDGVHSRLMGCGYFENHEFEGKDYPGRCWLGNQDDTNPSIVHPLTNDEAEQFAISLGFQKRDSKKTGTSLLIVDSQITSIDTLRESIEDWWWPRLIENNLDIELYADNERLDPPKPRTRNDLKPFIDCFELTQNIAPVINDKNTKLIKMKKFKENETGSMACKVVTDEIIEDLEILERLGSVALIRQKRMVITYLPANKDELAVGVFVASDNSYTEKVLKNSEPPSHIRWDPNSEELKKVDYKEGVETGTSRELVKYILNNIKRNLREFINELTSENKQDELRPKRLEKILGDFFRPQSKSKGGADPREVDPISITHLQETFEVVDSKIRSHASFAITLSDKAEESLAEIMIEISCKPELDEGIDDVFIPIEVNIENNDFEIVSESPTKIKMTLEKDKKVKVAVQSELYDPNWTTNLSIIVERK